MSKRRDRTLLPLYQASTPPPKTRTFQPPKRSRSFQPPKRTRSFESLSSSGRKDHSSLPSFTAPPKKSTLRCLSPTRTMSTATASPPQQEQLPDAAPLPTFFMPNILGIVFAYALEAMKVESTLRNIVSAKAHPYALLGLGVFAIANTNSYLGGSVVLARIRYGVKLPNLYANTSSKDGDKNKDGVAFNCVQRGHQNFLETYAQLVLSVLFVATLRPNIAGAMLIVVAIARVFYARSYRTDIPSRIGPLLIAIFTMSIGVGYGFLLGLSAFGIQMLDV